MQNFVAFSEYMNLTVHRGAFYQLAFRWNTTMVVINPPEKKLAKRTSVQLFGISIDSLIVNVSFKIVGITSYY